MTREEYLQTVIQNFIEPLFFEHGAKLPKYLRVSVGFPKGGRGGNKSIGQCWHANLSGDKVNEMFVSPELDVYRAVDVLIHECVHAAVGLEAGHKAPFKKLAVAVGLEGKMTATVAGKVLAAKIEEWVHIMPKWPGAPLRVPEPGTSTSGLKGPGSRLIKCECAGCGFIMRTTEKWLNAVGLPTCACGSDFTQS